MAERYVSTLLLIFATAAPLGATGVNAQQFSSHLVFANPTDFAARVVADQSGNLYTIGTTVTSVSNSPEYLFAGNTPTWRIRVTKTDGEGNVLATFVFGGSSRDTPYGAAVDAAGNVVIVGSTSSTDFPLVSPLAKTGAGFIAKVNSQLTQLLYSTRLGVAGTTIAAVTLDTSGDMFVTGNTQAGFTVTPGALQSVAASNSGFVAELSAAGDSLIFSTFYAGSRSVCTMDCVTLPGPTPTPAASVFTTPAAIALDASGNVVIAGTTNASDLAVSANAWMPQCNCTAQSPAGFVAKIGTAGTQLVWGTYIPGPNVSVSAMALDSSGDVVIAGTASTGFPITASAIQASYPAGQGAAGFLAELNATGSTLNFATYLGGNSTSITSIPPEYTNGPTALAVDGQGTIWVTGGSAPAALPAEPGASILGQNYIAGVSAGGSGLVSLFTSPVGSAGADLALTPQGSVAVLGAMGWLTISSSSPGPSVMGIVEMSAPAVSRAVCARELISLFGVDIGPATGRTAQIVNGVIPNSLGGVQVLFNGVPAALLYAGPNQINAIVPSAITFDQIATIQIVAAGGTINAPALPIEETIPQVLLNADGTTAAVNQDGTSNSPANHAAPGSIVSIWVVGGGASYTGASDNTINANPGYAQFLTSVYYAGASYPSLEVDYAGDAPDQPSGIMQINFRIPEGLGGLYEVEIGTGVTSAFTIY